MIRTTVHNEDGALKPEMYASVTIFTDEGDFWPAIPRDAVIYEGDGARVWVAHDDKTIERRSITARTDRRRDDPGDARDCNRARR